MIIEGKMIIESKPGFLKSIVLILLLVSAIGFNACREKIVPEADLSITIDEMTLSSEGGEVTTRISSDQSWSIKDIEHDWVEADQLSGIAGSSVLVTFTVGKNNSVTERTAVITVTSGSSSAKINILQHGLSGTIDPGTIDVSKIYIPQELRSMDLYKSSSTWYFGRSKQSQHFIVFWGKGYDQYGIVTPSDYPNASLRVDIDDLLAKAEEFYDMNVNTLKFLTQGASKTDNYKMMIFLLYQTEWLATGAGYDNMIGALWVSPSTCQPVGSTIAHEIGHSFQYQVYCDNGGNSGWRYGFGGNGGNGYWEQCAQWQSYQSYPAEAFSSYNFDVYIDNCHRSTFNEWQRYANYFINYYWADKHGIDIIGRLWRESGAMGQEDPAQAYMRIMGISLEEYNNEQFEYARKMVTWDMDNIREKGRNFIGAHSCSMLKVSDGYWQVAPESCIENHGYNVIRLNVPEAGTILTAIFEGMAGASGYRAINIGAAGWRYGYVALLKDGTRVYSDMFSDASGTASFTSPDNCQDLWFVVSSAPGSYWVHPWDEDASNDEQWPYKVKFDGSNIYGVIEFTDDDQPHDTSFVYNISFPADAVGYTGTAVSVDVVKLCYAFVMLGNDITSNTGLPGSGKKIAFYGVNSNGSLAATATATGLGHWFDASGNVCSWSSGTTGVNKVFSEFNATNFTFNIGQHPGRCKQGDVFKITQALIYSPDGVHNYRAAFEFNITITQ